MTDRAPLVTTFVPGILSFEDRLTRCIKKNVEGDRPETPYLAWSVRGNGVAPWESSRRYPHEITPVESDDPDFDQDVEIRYKKDVLLTVSQEIKGLGTQPLGEIARNVRRYWLYRFDEEACDQGLAITYRDFSDTGRSGQDLEGEREVSEGLDVQLVADLRDTRTKTTIEQLEFADSSDIAAGETVP